MGKHEQMTVPVVVRDDRFMTGWCVMYANEGEKMNVLWCDSEKVADDYLKEFERTGALQIPNPLIRVIEVIEPDVVVKAKTSDAVIKTYRMIDIPADYIDITVKI